MHPTMLHPTLFQVGIYLTAVYSLTPLADHTESDENFVTGPRHNAMSQELQMDEGKRTTGNWPNSSIVV